MVVSTCCAARLRELHRAATGCVSLTTQHPRCAEMRSDAPALLIGLLQNALAFRERWGSEVRSHLAAVSLLRHGNDALPQRWRPDIRADRTSSVTETFVVAVFGRASAAESLPGLWGSSAQALACQSSESRMESMNLRRQHKTAGVTRAQRRGLATDLRSNQQRP
jgi:hypothetical protein